MKIANSNKAIIVIHEIYGINEFIKDQCQQFRKAGYDIFCPNLINKPPFSYEESKEAYDFFMTTVGLEVYKEISMWISDLKEIYDKVFVIGFSVGATIAWRCCENSLCSGIIACYGSRIRDYTGLTPACPTLLLFARHDSFDVHGLILQLQDKQNVSIVEFDAEHGFVDSYSQHFNLEESKCAEISMTCFMNEHM